MCLYSKMKRKSLLCTYSSFFSLNRSLNFCGKIDVSTLNNDKRNANGAFFPIFISMCKCCCCHCFSTKKHYERTTRRDRKLRIPSIVLSTKDDMLIRGASEKLVFGKQLKTFCMQNCKTCHTTKIRRVTIVSRSLWLMSATPCTTFGINSPQICKISCQNSPIE